MDAARHAQLKPATHDLVRLPQVPILAKIYEVMGIYMALDLHLHIVMMVTQ